MGHQLAEGEVRIKSWFELESKIMWHWIGLEEVELLMIPAETHSAITDGSTSGNCYPIVCDRKTIQALIDALEVAKEGAK